MSKQLSKDTLIGYSAFTWWVKWEYPIEVKYMDVTEFSRHYESDYMRCWNYVRDCGWNKVGSFWISPEGMKFKTVYEAYHSQKFKEMVDSVKKEKL